MIHIVVQNILSIFQHVYNDGELSYTEGLQCDYNGAVTRTNDRLY